MASQLAERGMIMGFSISKQYNKERVFDINTEGFDYYSLEDIFASEDEVYVIHGIYINSKGLYDDAPVLALDDRFVNLPAHMTDTCLEILADKRAIIAIKDGTVGFSIYTYEQKKYKKTCYGIKWVDVTPGDEDATEAINEG